MSQGAKLSDKGLRAADMVKSGQGQTSATERAPGVWECRGVGNIYLVTTSDGDVLINAGTLADARRGQTLFAKVSENLIDTIILTQSHANQYGGLEVFKTLENTVLVHKLYPEERAYNEALSAHYRRGSRRIFGGITGRTEDMLPTREIVPDIFIGDEGHSFDLGGRRFEIIWTPGGETRSAVIVWLPIEKIAIVGNLFGPLFGNHPNLNTMRGDKPRSALQFIDSVRKLRALGPEMILTGHEQINGADHIKEETGRIIDAVQWVHDRTIEGMNEGKDIRTLMREVSTPSELALTEEYGKVAWNVRAIWHEYTGWFDPARGTTELYGVPPSSVAPAIAALAGGIERLTECARDFTRQSRPIEALHVLDIALAAEPGNAVAKQSKRDALVLLDQQSGGRNLWERMWIAAAIRDLEVLTNGETFSRERERHHNFQATAKFSFCGCRLRLRGVIKMNERMLPSLEIDAQVELSFARIQLARLNHMGPSVNTFCREGVYWIDLCLTPRRPTASARYLDHWGPHRSAELGALIALPPGQRLELKNAGGKHASLLCQLHQEAVERFLPESFEWTDRRLEACLALASEPIRSLLLRLNHELKSPGLATETLCEAVTTQLSLELARYLWSVSEPDEKGGLASWRQRLIDERIHDQDEPPTLIELARLCRISVRQLTRGFKASRGCPIGEYLAQTRIETAKRKLVSSDNLKSVSKELGYASQSSFTAAFRRATGTTPNQYRKQFGSKRTT